MFDRTSRYYGLGTRTLDVIEPDGTTRPVRYVLRRFIPATSGATLVEYSIAQVDRLDNITARYLGDPTQFWRVCDANDVLIPEELTDAVGRVIHITLPQPS